MQIIIFNNTQQQKYESVNGTLIDKKDRTQKQHPQEKTEKVMHPNFG
jgi:hypothetical protein